MGVVAAHHGHPMKRRLLLLMPGEVVTYIEQESVPWCVEHNSRWVKRLHHCVTFEFAPITNDCVVEDPPKHWVEA